MTNINSLLKAYMDCLLFVLEEHSADQLAFLNERVSRMSMIIFSIQIFILLVITINSSIIN